jgi:hypothetical protein
MRTNDYTVTQQKKIYGMICLQVFLQNHYNDTHFNDAGHMESFNYICSFISKYNV